MSYQPPPVTAAAPTQAAEPIGAPQPAAITYAAFAPPVAAAPISYVSAAPQTAATQASTITYTAPASYAAAPPFVMEQPAAAAYATPAFNAAPFSAHTAPAITTYAAQAAPIKYEAMACTAPAMMACTAPSMQYEAQTTTYAALTAQAATPAMVQYDSAGAFPVQQQIMYGAPPTQYTPPLTSFAAAPQAYEPMAMTTGYQAPQTVYQAPPTQLPQGQQALFDAIDHNHDGFITRQDFQQAIHDGVIKPHEFQQAMQ